jgi:hypothetical protein
LAHAKGAAITSMINAGSSTTDKQDSTFLVRAGLSNTAYYSFESRNFLRSTGPERRWRQRFAGVVQLPG